MVGESVEPDAVAGATGTVAFTFCEEAAGGGVFGVVGGAGPMDEGVEVCPGVGYGADVEKLAEQGEGFGRRGTWNMRGLGGVVCTEGHGRGERTKFMLGGGEKNRETFLEKG